MVRILFFLFLLVVFSPIYSQILVEGYVFESANRGYIDNAEVTISPIGSEQVIGFASTSADGQYRITIGQAGEYSIRINKPPYFDHQENLTINSLDKVFLRHELQRSPGYIFELTLAEKNPAPDAPRDALKGALIEVYNNTKRQEEFVIDEFEGPDFKVDLIKGNHYTILIRKDGFISKRLEAFVDVEGCILCFEGVGKVDPGVSDNLSEKNTIGVLLANIEMERVFEGKKFGIDNIYYDLNKSDINPAAAKELRKVAVFLKDNPELRLELGSHTDSRGKESFNAKLSEDRAKAAVSYLVNRLKINGDRLTAKGYGETQLANECGDGVKCSEEQHQENRRTELKVIDFLTSGERKSLRQLKTEEFMDQILAELEEEGQVKVNEGENIEEVIANNNRNGRESRRKLEDAVNDAAREELEVVQKKKEEETAEEKKKSNADTAQPAQKELNKPESKAGVQVNKDKLEKDEPIIANTPAKDMENFSPEKAAVKSIDAINNESGDMSEYTGFKVVLMFSRYELPEIHPIFSSYDDVVVYTTADGNKLYMVGNYKSYLEATKSMIKDYRAKFPQSYVVGFEKGVRTY